MDVTRIGLDLAKNILEIRSMDEREQAVLRKSVLRAKVLETFVPLHPCMVGREDGGDKSTIAQVARSKRILICSIAFEWLERFASGG